MTFIHNIIKKPQTIIKILKIKNHLFFFSKSDVKIFTTNLALLHKLILPQEINDVVYTKHFVFLCNDGIRYYKLFKNEFVLINYIENLASNSSLICCEDSVYTLNCDKIFAYDDFGIKKISLENVSKVVAVEYHSFRNDFKERASNYDDKKSKKRLNNVNVYKRFNYEQQHTKGILDGTNLFDDNHKILNDLDLTHYKNIVIHQIDACNNYNVFTYINNILKLESKNSLNNVKLVLTRKDFLIIHHEENLNIYRNKILIHTIKVNENVKNVEIENNLYFVLTENKNLNIYSQYEIIFELKLEDYVFCVYNDFICTTEFLYKLESNERLKIVGKCENLKIKTLDEFLENEKIGFNMEKICEINGIFNKVECCDEIVKLYDEKNFEYQFTFDEIRKNKVINIENVTQTHDDYKETFYDGDKIYYEDAVDDKEITNNKKLSNNNYLDVDRKMTTGEYLSVDNPKKLKKNSNEHQISFENFIFKLKGNSVIVFDTFKNTETFILILHKKVKKVQNYKNFVYILLFNGQVMVSKFCKYTKSLEIPIKMNLETVFNIHKNICFSLNRFYVFLKYEYACVKKTEDLVAVEFYDNFLILIKSSKVFVYSIEAGNEGKFLFNGLVMSNLMNDSRKDDNDLSVEEKEGFSEIRTENVSKNNIKVEESELNNCPAQNLKKYKSIQSLKNFKSLVDDNFVISENKIKIVKENGEEITREFDDKIECGVVFGKNVVIGIKNNLLVFLIGKKNLICKSQRKLSSKVVKMLVNGDEIFVQTKINSLICFKIAENALDLVASDPIDREISNFTILNDNILFYDVNGSICILQKIYDKYEIVMNWNTNEEIVDLKFNQNFILYLTKFGKVGAIICIENKIYEVLSGFEIKKKIMCGICNIGILDWNFRDELVAEEIEKFELSYKDVCIVIRIVNS